MPAIPRYMDWSDQEISWSQADHPKVMPRPGSYALVLDPTLVRPSKNVKFSRTLIDDGSSINIMYRDTMNKLGVTENMLEPSKTTFHGIVPGVSCTPMGMVRVDVVFGTKENCRVENIEFEVVDLSSPYHMLLDRPAMHKFMAVAHISYLKLKMPGPNGIITITGNYKRSLECSSAGSNLAQSMVIAQERKRIQEVVALAHAGAIGLADLGNPQGVVSFKPTKDTKAIQLDDDPEHVVNIGAGMDPK